MSELRTNKIYPRDGLPAGASGGGIIQVVESSTSTEVTVNSTSYQDIGLSATITPTSSSNKILILCQIQIRVFINSVDNGGSIALVRTIGGSSTDLVKPSQGYQIGYNPRSAYSDTSETSYMVPYDYLDSPGTTSACTYKIQGRVRNTSGTNSVQFQDDNYYQSRMILMEVSG